MDLLPEADRPERAADQVRVARHVRPRGVEVEPPLHQRARVVDRPAAEHQHQVVGDGRAASRHLRGLVTIAHTIGIRDLPARADRVHHHVEVAEEQRLELVDRRLRPCGGIERDRVHLRRLAGVGGYAPRGELVIRVERSLRGADRPGGDHTHEELGPWEPVERAVVHRLARVRAVKAVGAPCACGTRARRPCRRRCRGCPWPAARRRPSRGRSGSPCAAAGTCACRAGRSRRAAAARSPRGTPSRSARSRSRNPSAR